MFAQLLERLHLRHDLTEEEAAAAMASIMDGEAKPAEIAGLLIALRMKGERTPEIVGLARTMRDRAVRLTAEFTDAFDTCGTGGDGGGTFNISSVVALVVAGSGVRVAKHGNRSVSSKCGSADLFAQLGVNVSASPATVTRCLEEAGIAFLFAPTFHPSMRHAAEPRRDLGVRTAFNLLGPLTNPARAAFQLVGVPRPELTELVAHALAHLGTTRAWVVHGADGIDEISTRGYTKVSECRGGFVRTFYLHPGDIGLSKAAPGDLAGGDAAVNADIAKRILAGEAGPRRDVILLNAAAALLVAGRCKSLVEGLQAARASIDEGRAEDVLGRLVATSNEEVVA